jgi:3-hydroxyacyl-CoA dehydrogenase
MPPGAGGTQLLPRAVALEDALAAVRTGRPFRVDDEHLGGLVDVLVTDPSEVLAAAVELATGEGVRSAILVRDRAIRHPHPEGLLAFAAAQSSGLERRIAELMLAGVHDVDAGFAAELTAFRDHATTTSAAAQRHLFFAERAAGRPIGPPPRDVSRVAVIGSGTMGSGIASAALATGAAVTLIDTDIERVVAAASRIRERLGDAVPLAHDVELAAAANADVVIEAVFEDLAVKRDVFRVLDEVTGPEAILATNTSTLSVREIASSVRHPERVVGMHFFSPADVMPLVELIRADASSEGAVATAQAFARRMGKTVVRSADAPGFIGNRLVDAYHRQAMQLLGEGVSPQQIDGALERWGMRMGPFRVMDLIGLDVLAAGRRAERGADPDWAPADDLVRRGALGRKTGVGWYLYADGRLAVASPELPALLPAQRSVDEREIVERCVFALVNAGAAVLVDGVAERAGDIDVVYTTGYGFPRERGGPMFYAGTVGLDHVVRAMRRFAAGSPTPDVWEPHPLLIEALGSSVPLHERSSR